MEAHGQIVRWREPRGNGLSETTYTGIAVTIDGADFVVAKLSHGLRPLRRKKEWMYVHEEDTTPLTLTDSFIGVVRNMIMADEELQTKQSEFDALLESNS